MILQDLHIHTIYSSGDSAVVKEMTIQFISEIKHAEIIGISDHFEYLTGEIFEKYEKEVRFYGFKLGTEVNGYHWVKPASKVNCDYYIYHCFAPGDYEAIDILLNTNKPVIIAHPFMLDTDLDKIPPECYIEINNRYIWRADWKNQLQKYINKFKFVLSSDAHQPNWLNQNVARYVCEELGIKETILF
jgi:hypothetical protein